MLLTTWIQILAVPFTSCETLGSDLNLSGPPFIFLFTRKKYSLPLSPLLFSPFDGSRVARDYLVF